MVRSALAFVLLILLLTGCAVERKEERLVDVLSIRPDIFVEIPYATEKNFTRRVLYPLNLCLLRESVAERLSRVQEDLSASGRKLKVLDCYRPLSIQKKLWGLVPDERYVANPYRSPSRHNRGAAVDVTLADEKGQELPMPTGYDDFSEKAHRDYWQAPPETLQNRSSLEESMQKHGFIGLPTEWWHFDSGDWEAFPVLDIPFDEALSTRTVSGQSREVPRQGNKILQSIFQFLKKESVSPR